MSSSRWRTVVADKAAAQWWWAVLVFATALAILTGFVVSGV